MIKLIKMNKNI